MPPDPLATPAPAAPVAAKPKKGTAETFDSKPIKQAMKEVSTNINYREIQPSEEIALSQGQNEILAALQHDTFPSEIWSMVQPYINMKYIGLFGTAATFNDEQCSILNGLELENENTNIFENLFFSTKQEQEENPLLSMKDYFADRNVIAAIKDISIETNTISANLMAQRKVSLAFDIFDVNALNSTIDSKPEEKFLRALLTIGTSFKLQFGYPPGSFNVDFSGAPYFKENFDLYFKKEPYYEMIITHHGIPDISIDQKGTLHVKVNFLEATS